MADHDKAETEKNKVYHQMKSFLIFGASLMSNILVNSYVGVNLYFHKEFFSSDPGREFVEICTDFQSLQQEILNIHAFILPFFASYWLIDIVSDLILLYVLLKNDFSPVMVLLKLINMLLFLYVGGCYFIVTGNLDNKLLVGFSVFLSLKIGFAFFTLLREIKRVQKLRGENEVKKIEPMKTSLSRKKVLKAAEDQAEFVNGDLHRYRPFQWFP